jgi:prepilin-type N-terminal cleavage/methylation domain-containing protein
MTRTQKGFTLVELSIVLVIIGLIISSVLVGQDLIRGAEIRSTITQYENFNSAVGTFKGKYGGLPGDVKGKTDYGWLSSGDDGDGDGILDGHAAHTNEVVWFWNHLGATGAALISGTFTGADISTSALSTPKGKVGSQWGVFSASDINYYILGAKVANSGTNYTTEGFLVPLDAKNIDDKIDDGRPGRGLVQARGAGNSDPDAGAVNTCASAVSSGVPTAASTYVTTGTSTTCNLMFRMPY